MTVVLKYLAAPFQMSTCVKRSPSPPVLSNHLSIKAYCVHFDSSIGLPYYIDGAIVVSIQVPLLTQVMDCMRIILCLNDLLHLSPYKVNMPACTVS